MSGVKTVPSPDYAALFPSWRVEMREDGRARLSCKEEGCFHAYDVTPPVSPNARRVLAQHEKGHSALPDICRVKE